MQAIKAGDRTAYDQVQQAIGEPKSVMPQVEQALTNLRESIDFNEELLAVLLRRLSPVTSERDPVPNGISSTVPKTPLVLLASQLDTLFERIRIQNREIEWAIKALEI